MGLPDAMYDLGLCYASGTGVARDRAKAEEWFNKAASRGVERARQAIRMYE